MKKIYLSTLVLLLSGCATLENLWEGNFKTAEQCMANLTAELDEKNLSESLRKEALERGEKLCVNSESLADLADVRELLEKFQAE